MSPIEWHASVAHKNVVQENIFVYVSVQHRKINQKKEINKMPCPDFEI